MTNGVSSPPSCAPSAPGSTATDAEVERLRKEIARAEGMLANENFVTNAPAARGRAGAREARALSPSSLRSRVDLTAQSLHDQLVGVPIARVAACNYGLPCNRERLDPVESIGGTRTSRQHSAGLCVDDRKPVAPLPADSFEVACNRRARVRAGRP